MLVELRISNYAVIDRLSLEFSRGFHVLTGETGAGKSILVDAIALLVGGRASADQIRADTEESVLEAAFSLPPSASLLDQFRDAGLVGPHETELIVRRVLSRSGRNRIYVNGNLAPLQVIQGLAGTLVDIHGQHEQQSLLSAHAQLDALDAFGCLKDLRTEYARHFERWRLSRRELETLTGVASELTQREELLRFQLRELDEANIQPGEEAVLTGERRRLTHTHRLNELTQRAYELLYGADVSVLAALGAVSDRLKELESIDAETVDWRPLCDGATIQLRELSDRLRDYREGLEQDPLRLAQVEERLVLLGRLKAKYGANEEALISVTDDLRCQLEELAASDMRVAEAREQVVKEYAQVEALANGLSEHRAQAARTMEARIKEELYALRMDHTRFLIKVHSDSTESALAAAGRDRVEFLLSANPGEPLLPLTRVASGGELSRVMLAMKTVLAETDQVAVLIFDEIDAGVGGAVAAVMGRRLRSLANYHQVFCITHLPQIASQAESHFVVEKGLAKNRTITRVRRLDRAGRQEEIARMLSGTAITQAGRKTAAELIGEAESER